MSLQKVQEMAAKAGVSSGDAAMLFSKGMTPDVIERAAAAGCSFKDLFNLFMQFGPMAVTIISSFLAACKKPVPNEGGGEPAPQSPTPQEPSALAGASVMAGPAQAHPKQPKARPGVPPNLSD